MRWRYANFFKDYEWHFKIPGKAKRQFSQTLRQIKSVGG